MLDLLADTGVGITVYDNLSNGKLEFIQDILPSRTSSFVKADILDRERLVEEIKGHELVWHLAANTDIINSHDYPQRDSTMASSEPSTCLRPCGCRVCRT